MTPTRQELKTYLKRTERFLRDWQTKVPRKLMDLDEWNTYMDTHSSRRLPSMTRMKDCGAVACLGGWGEVLYKKYWYGLRRWLGLHVIVWRGDADHLFDIQRTELSPYREATNRLKSRIRQLKRLLAESER